MSIFRKTLSCAVLAALGTCALAGCGRQDTSNEATTSASPEMSAAITETVSESTAASEPTPTPDAPGTQSTQPADVTSEADKDEASTPFGQHGALHVENGKLTDADGNTVQLYGMPPTVLPGSPSISIMIPSVPCGTTGILTVSASPCIQRNTAVIVPAVIRNS